MGLLKDSNDHFLPKEQGSFSKTKISWAISNTIPNITFFHFLSRYLCLFTLSSPLPSRNHLHPRKKRTKNPIFPASNQLRSSFFLSSSGYRLRPGRRSPCWEGEQRKKTIWGKRKGLEWVPTTKSKLLVRNATK